MFQCFYKFNREWFYSIGSSPPAGSSTYISSNRDYVVAKLSRKISDNLVVVVHDAIQKNRFVFRKVRMFIRIKVIIPNPKTRIIIEISVMRFFSVFVNSANGGWYGYMRNGRNKN